MQRICKAAAYLGFNNLCDEPVSLELEQSFIDHVSRYGLSFGTKEEYEFRFQQYAQKDAEINEINARETNFRVAHNFMSTWTDFEYKQLLGYSGQAGEIRGETVTLLETNAAEVDWREKGAVQLAVKNQYHCGGCWAFSALCAVEGAEFVQNGDLPNLSEQQVISCDTTSYGCKGGWQSHAFKYLETHVSETWSAYPYFSGQTGQTGACNYDKTQGTIEVDSFINVPANSTAQLKAAIAKQPVSVTLEADKRVFQMYSDGIFDSPDCGTNLDHAVAAVGYGTEGGKEYYIVRNSWSSSWGEMGYIRIAIEEGQGICGIQKESLYPAVKKATKN